VYHDSAFGEDDYRVCLKEGVIAKGESVPCPVDDDGRFTAEVTDFFGVHVKDAGESLLSCSVVQCVAMCCNVSRCTLRHCSCSQVEDAGVSMLKMHASLISPTRQPCVSCEGFSCLM